VFALQRAEVGTAAIQALLAHERLETKDNEIRDFKKQSVNDYAIELAANLN
jgi:hypothetical protein